MDDKRKHDLWGALLKYCQGKCTRTVLLDSSRRKYIRDCVKYLKIILELIKKEGEEAAKKKKEILAERITPLPTLNGMSKSTWVTFLDWIWIE